jgi:hypothetical protein
MHAFFHRPPLAAAIRVLRWPLSTGSFISKRQTATITNATLSRHQSKQGIDIASSYIIMSLLPKSLSGKLSDSGGSNCGGSGNNSDNSALISIGNTSFGFNFDSEEGHMNQSPRNSTSNSEEGDSDEGPGKQRPNAKGNPKTSVEKAQSRQPSAPKPAKVSSGSDTSTSNMSRSNVASHNMASHNDAAAAAVANLQSIANSANKAAENGELTRLKYSDMSQPLESLR